MMIFNEYTHKLLYDFFIEELEGEQSEVNKDVNQNEDMCETTPQNW